MPRKSRRRGNMQHSEEVLVLVGQANVAVMEQYMASPWLLDNLALKFEWHTLFAWTMESAAELVRRNVCPELFNAYLILGSRWFSHHESIGAILATGRYGDCMALMRSLLEDTDLIAYFSHFPNDAADWRNQLGRAPVWPDKVYRQGTQKFRMPQIWKKLRAKGIEPVAERDYAVLSATVHATPWGARFYGRILPGDPNRIHLSLAQAYDASASFSTWLILEGTYPRPIEAFLTSCTASRAPRSVWRSIEARYNALIGKWQEQLELHSWFQDVVACSEERILQGEDPETVLGDMRRRWDERYGEAPNATQ